MKFVYHRKLIQKIFFSRLILSSLSPIVGFVTGWCNALILS